MLLNLRKRVATRKSEVSVTLVAHRTWRFCDTGCNNSGREITFHFCMGQSRDYLDSLHGILERPRFGISRQFEERAALCPRAMQGLQADGAGTIMGSGSY